MGVINVIETCLSRNTKTKSKAQRKKINKERNVAKKTLQRTKFKIMLSEAFSFAMWSTIPPIPFKAILDPLKCQMEAFY